MTFVFLPQTEIVAACRYYWLVLLLKKISVSKLRYHCYCSFPAVYYPPGKTTVTIYDKIKQHDPFIAECSFEFVSRNQILADVLERATDPQQLLCDSCGISTADITQFDEAMAKQIQQKAPNDFHLLDDTQKFPGKTEGGISVVVIRYYFTLFSCILTCSFNPCI